MLNLTPLHFEKIWGYENWIASTHKDGPQPEFVSFAKNFPLLVKVIQADSTLSVQIHPDDKNAAALEGDGNSGKTECWYVLDAKPGSKLVYGFKKDYLIEEIRNSIEKNTLENLLNQVEVKKGDFVFIPAGTVHAIGGGLRLLEVQQSCNITYRFYDWGRGRELHIEKGLKSVKTSEQIKKELNTKMDGSDFELSKISPFGSDFECNYFEIVKKTVKGGYSYLVPKNGAPELLFVINAERLSAKSTDANGNKSEIKNLYAEQILAFSSGEKVTLEGSGEIFRIKAKN
ncbi:MAG: type I phosphomannose isomerase catalytic subunit [Treponema sp.]|nr:type I phosphomannose isomerase catalytic subunit [Treponema sp.]